MAQTITYIAPGSSDSKETLVPDGTTVEELLVDFLDISSGSISVTINGSPLETLDGELEDGDEIVISTKKHASGIDTRA